MTQLLAHIVNSELYRFAHEAHEARYPAYAWKTVACDIIGIPAGSRPTVTQMMDVKCSWMTLYQELAHRFYQLNTVRWQEHLECQEENIHNALVHLGATPLKVAERLRRMGIMGDATQAHDCPIGHFLRGVYGAWFAGACAPYVTLDFVKVATPLGVELFISHFDDGSYAELDLFPDRAFAI